MVSSHGAARTLIGRSFPHRATAASPYEISARLLVRGPKTPITRITMTIAKAMKEKTPVGPKCSRMKAVR
jgi:hypothetical protein